ncbi:flagellar biosynthetic protein FliQ [Endozoicomonas sp.]|uniref:flagellar biosynthetic protein FliQ n=1 Tax=Endozoicomonas sp. TaxID=1892382 RepID=UPI00383B5E3A
MTPDNAVYMLSQALWTVTWLAAVLIVPGLIIGLVVSIVQAATQVTEQTLSFLPRLLVTLLTLSLGLHWLVRVLGKLFYDYFATIATLQ